MTRHIILWKLKPMPPENKAAVIANIKTGLEGLLGVVPGIVSISVHTHGLPSSNADLMLESSFIDDDALNGYFVHPAHLAVATTKVRPFVETKLCLDFAD
ncbi:MAG: Dabb family protein [Victivallaceae bacterium]|nr:Dabb family protein [Victivallaceae bacterium]